MKRSLMLAFSLILLACQGLANESTARLDQTRSNQTDWVSYSIGYQVGSDFIDQGIELRPDLLIKGIQDALAQTEPSIPPERMRATLVDLQKQVAAWELTKQRQAQEKYRGEGREFLAENARKEGVVSLPSGLQYQVLSPGQGRHPGITDKVRVAYRSLRLDGQEFDRSPDGQPAEFSLNHVIPAWKEALPLMAEGAKWKLFVPADLAYGERGPLADKAVIFEMELLEVLN
jgi:FKBP-type peptidyl-prolyl cis-trans isomerase FklB